MVMVWPEKAIRCEIDCKLQDGTVFTKKGYNETETELFEFRTDEEQVIDGLDKVVMTMNKGEVDVLTIDPVYAFSSTESKHELAAVPSNSIVIYEIELVSFVKEKESWDMNTQEKIEALGKRRMKGTPCLRAVSVENNMDFLKGNAFQLDDVIEAQQFDRDIFTAIFEVACEMEKIEKKSGGNQL